MISSTHPRGATDTVMIPRLLVVDDLAENLKLMGEVFDTELIEVSFAKNGFRAVKLAEMSRFQIAILDINLPDLDGFEVAKRILALQPDCEIIFCSAQNDRETREQGALMGAIDFIEKPFDVDLTRSRMKLHVDRLLLRHQLALEHHRMNVVFDNIHDAVVWVNSDDKIVGLNRRAIELFGKAETEMKGRPFGVLLPESAEIRSLNAIFDRGDTQLKLTIQGADDKPIQAQASVTSWSEPDGRFLAVAIAPLKAEALAAVNQVDDKRIDELTAEISRLKSEVERRTQELIHSERMASIGTLAAGVAHEINNPLAYVKSNLISLGGYLKPLVAEVSGLTKIAKDSPELAASLRERGLIEDPEELGFIIDDVHEIIEDLVDGSERIVTIVRGLRQFSHPATEEWKPVDLNDAVKTAYELVRNEVKHKGLVNMNLASLSKVHASNSEITQVLVNLIVNAAQALPEMGGVIEITSKDETDSVMLTVADNGQGIAKADIGQIFDPFFTTKPVGEGTGLGLAISQRIVENHGGTISVESQVEKGTVFTLRFPKSESQ